jgi:hypothetical protein
MATGWHMVLGSLPLLAVSAAREGPELATHLSQLNGESRTCQYCNIASAQHVLSARHWSYMQTCKMERKWCMCIT